MKYAQLVHDLSAKLSPAARAELENIVKLPEVEAIREREENAEIERRKSLIAIIKKTPADHAEAIAKAAKHCIAATARIEALHHETIAARQAHVAATAAMDAAELGPRVEALEAEKELRRTADTRLGDFIFFLGEIDDRVRQSLQFGEYRTRDKWSGEGLTIIENNLPSILSARAELQDLIAELDALRLAAIPRDEITNQLRKMSSDLTPLLVQFDLAPPIINERNEVEWLRRTPSFEALQSANLAPKDGSKWVDGKLVEAGSKK